MERRVLLTAIPAAMAGCTVGYSNVGPDPDAIDQELSSRGSDDRPIRASVEELLPTTDDFETGGWGRRETDDENCREFYSSSAESTTVLTVCVWVLDDVAAAEDAFETRLERVWKLSRGEPTEVEPPVGVDTRAIRDRSTVHIVFRDANAVGTVEYARDFTGPPNPDDFPEVEEALKYAVLVHDDWRD